MISFTVQSTGNIVTLQKGNLIGKGSFGKIYLLHQNNGRKTDLVCKEISLNHPKNKGFFSKTRYQRSFRLWEAVNEIKHLHQLGLLIGYENKHGIFYIIMKRIKGRSLSLENSQQQKEIFYNAYKALRRLHRLGYVHLDSHVNNFIVSDERHVTLTDFSRMQSFSLMGCLMDFITFFSGKPENCSVIDFYFREKWEYFRQHPVSVTSKLMATFFMGAMVFWGEDFFPVTAPLIKKLIVSSFLQEISNSINLRFTGAFPLTICSIISLSYIAFCNLSQGLELLTTNEHYGNPFVWVYLAHLLKQLLKLITLMDEFVEDYILPESVISKKMDLLHKYIYPQSSRFFSMPKDVIKQNASLSPSRPSPEKRSFLGCDNHRSRVTTPHC